MLIKIWLVKNKATDINLMVTCDAIIANIDDEHIDAIKVPNYLNS